MITANTTRHWFSCIPAIFCMAELWLRRECMCSFWFPVFATDIDPDEPEKYWPLIWAEPMTGRWCEPSQGEKWSVCHCCQALCRCSCLFFLFSMVTKKRKRIPVARVPQWDRYTGIYLRRKRDRCTESGSQILSLWSPFRMIPAIFIFCFRWIQKIHRTRWGIRPYFQDFCDRRDYM